MGNPSNRRLTLPLSPFGGETRPYEHVNPFAEKGRNTHVNIAICERIGEGERKRRERITCLAGTAGMRIADYVQVESRGRHVRRVAAGRAIMRRRRVSIDRRGREARRRRPRPRELRTTERATSFRNYACARVLVKFVSESRGNAWENDLRGEAITKAGLAQATTELINRARRG